MKKNDTNNLRQDSIVKCDDLIEISENEIRFKIGPVTEEDLSKFIDTYSKYLNEELATN